MKRLNRTSTPKVFRYGRRKESRGTDMSSKMGKVDLNGEEWINKIPECPVYSPSEQEFEDPLVYLHKIAFEAYKYGIYDILFIIDKNLMRSFYTNR